PPMRRVGGARTQYESRALGVNFPQHEYPAKARVGDMRAVGITERQQATRRNGGHREARRPLWPVWPGIADLPVLKLRKDTIGAGVVDMPDQLVETRVGIPAAAMVAHLHHPWPYRGDRRADRDRPRSLDLRLSHKLVPWERFMRLECGGAGAPGQAASQVHTS